MDETYRREPQKSESRRPADSVVLVKGGALDAVLSQSALWVLMPWFALAIGSNTAALRVSDIGVTLGAVHPAAIRVMATVSLRGYSSARRSIGSVGC